MKPTEIYVQHQHTRKVDDQDLYYGVTAVSPFPGSVEITVGWIDKFWDSEKFTRLSGLKVKSVIEFRTKKEYEEKWKSR